MLLASLALADSLSTGGIAPPVAGYVDLHIHIAAHLAVPVYGKGPEVDPPDGRTNMHDLRQQIFAKELAAPGPSIFVSLAYANPMSADFETRRSMHARIERQLAYVEDFCVRHADRFGLAKTPEEARAIVASGRSAIVHGIEGATKILFDRQDAQEWADRGVAVITPVHLADNRIGGAWCQEGVLAVLNVPGCWREALGPRRHGLSTFGKERIADLIDAGIVIDLAHMSDASFAETLPLLDARAVAPVYTHVNPRAVRRDSIALEDDELRAIATRGGLVGVTSNLSHLRPRPIPELPAGHCENSIDDLRLQWDHIVRVMAGPVGWGSDFQGGINHVGPKYGPRGCAPAAPGASPFDVGGLIHPGLVEPMFQALGAAGSDLAPLSASAERFVQIWERARGVRGPPGGGG